MQHERPSHQGPSRAGRPGRPVGIVLISLFALSTILNCATTDSHRQYLDAAALPLDPTVDETVRPVAAHLSQSRVVLVGEEHGVVANQEIEAALFEELVRNHGVSVYLAESAYSFAAFVQHYIETGDRDLLDQLTARLEGTNAGVVEHREFFLGLHELYQELPPEKRFRYVGIDIEHMDAVAVSYLRWKLRQAQEHLAGSAGGSGARGDSSERAASPSNLAALHARLEALLSDASFDRRGVRGVAEVLRAEIVRAGDAFPALFPGDASGIRIVLDNIIAKHERDAAGSPTERKQRRDAAIHRTFRRVDAMLGSSGAGTADPARIDPAPRYFGQWGAAHAFQRPLEGIDWFASRLVADGTSVSSTLLIYMDCRVLERKPYREETLNTWGRLDVSRRVLRRLGPTPLFIPIRGGASPYHETPFRSGGRSSEYSLAELVDNVILIRGSGANTPYRP